jgi:heme exporter protein D
MRIHTSTNNILALHFGSYMPYVWLSAGVSLSILEVLLLFFKAVGSLQIVIIILSIVATLIITVLLASMNEHFKIFFDKEKQMLIIAQRQSQVTIPYDNFKAIWVNRVINPHIEGDTQVQVHLIRSKASSLEIYNGKNYNELKSNIELLLSYISLPVYVSSIEDTHKEKFLAPFATLSDVFLDISPEARQQLANPPKHCSPIRISNRRVRNISIFANDQAIWLEWSVLKWNTIIAIILSIFVCITFIYASVKFFARTSLLGYIPVLIGIALLCFAIYSLLYYYLSRQVIFIDAEKMIYRKTLFSSQEEVSIPIKEIKRSQGNLINQYKALFIKLESSLQEITYENAQGQLFYTANPTSWEHAEIDLQALSVAERFLLEDVVLEMIESNAQDQEDANAAADDEALTLSPKSGNS